MTTPVLTQRQVPTTFVIEDGCQEKATCPYCDQEIYGVWVKDPSELVPQVTCIHFHGFIAGAGGKPTAFFRGSSLDLEDKK